MSRVRKKVNINNTDTRQPAVNEITLVENSLIYEMQLYTPPSPCHGVLSCGQPSLTQGFRQGDYSNLLIATYV